MSQRGIQWSEAAIEEQAPLPTFSTPLARPFDGQAGACCPLCESDVSDSKKAHLVDVDAIVDPRVDESRDEVPVFGYLCDYDGLVLAVDPDSSTSTPGPGTGDRGWIAVEAELASGQGLVLVPSEVIL